MTYNVFSGTLNPAQSQFYELVARTQLKFTARDHEFTH